MKKLKLLLGSVIVFFLILCYLNNFSAAECASNPHFAQNYVSKINNLLLIPNQVHPLILSNQEMIQIAQNCTSLDQIVEVLQHHTDEHVRSFEKPWVLDPTLDKIISFSFPLFGFVILYSIFYIVVLR